MKMVAGGVKGIGAILTLWITYIDQTFTPLIWGLLILAFIDILLNVHKEGQQFQKIGSAAVSMGLPTLIANHIGIPDVGKYLVAMMVIVYLQLVVPQLTDRLSKLTFSKDPKQNAIDQAAIDAAVQKAMASIGNQAQAVLDSAKQAATGPVNLPVNSSVIQGVTPVDGGGNGGA